MCYNNALEASNSSEETPTSLPRTASVSVPNVDLGFNRRRKERRTAGVEGRFLFSKIR